MNLGSVGREVAELSGLRGPCGHAMLTNSWECHKMRLFALRPMENFFTSVKPYIIR